MSLVGRDEPVTLHELLPEAGDSAKLARFEEALAAFERGEVETAEAAFRAIEGDGPASFYAKACRKALRDGIEAPWSGVVVADAK